MTVPYAPDASGKLVAAMPGTVDAGIRGFTVMDIDDIL
jgi:hypothetical protein